MRKIAIVYSSYDGILNEYCGVGSITQSFINSFSKCRKVFLKKNISLSLHLLTIALRPESIGYHTKLLERAKMITEGSGGTVHFLLNNSDGNIPYGDVAHWESASLSAATVICNLSSEYDEIIVFAVDTPFLKIPYFIDQQKNAYKNLNIRSVIVLHSDALIHERQTASLSRLSWEAGLIKYYSNVLSITFASTSRFLEEHLISEYAIPKSQFIPMQTGITLSSERYAILTEDSVVTKLSHYKIPLNKKLIFSVGRAVEYKGFELLLRAYNKIKSASNHLVFIASPYYHPDLFVQKLQDIIKELDLSEYCTPIFHVDFDLPMHIAQWRNTKLVSQLSIYEPFGIVPEEVRMWAKFHGPTILTSNRDGFLEQIDDGKDGFLTEVDSIDSVALKMETILAFSEEKMSVYRQAGYERLCRDFNYEENLLNTLSNIIIENKK